MLGSKYLPPISDRIPNKFHSKFVHKFPTFAFFFCFWYANSLAFCVPIDFILLVVNLLICICTFNASYDKRDKTEEKLSKPAKYSK